MAEFLESENLKGLSGIRHGFFTRNGGISSGLYTSLNCGYGSGDDPANVSANRSRVIGALGLKNGSSVITPYQTHSADVAVADRAWERDRAPRADAVITGARGLAIGILSADCGAVLFADEKAGLIAAAHAGWRGSIDGVLEATVDRLVLEGAERSRISAAIGPCLHQQSYEVGPEFMEAFIARDPAYAAFFVENSDTKRPHFDLPAFIMNRLRGAGLEDIACTGLCTCENESQFFSYRRNFRQNAPDYGRQITAIVLT